MPQAVKTAIEQVNQGRRGYQMGLDPTPGWLATQIVGWLQQREMTGDNRQLPEWMQRDEDPYFSFGNGELLL